MADERKWLMERGNEGSEVRKSKGEKKKEPKEGQEKEVGAFDACDRISSSSKYFKGLL